jgi:hypothetical protein
VVIRTRRPRCWRGRSGAIGGGHSLTRVAGTDHFSASVEPERPGWDGNIAGKAQHSGKIDDPMEQNAVVAAPSQLRTITAPALPRSNQIRATLFDLMSQHQ